MKPFLVQRGMIQYRDFKKGIDSIVKFDYMGSAEFEWGALPESLGKIRENQSNYSFQEFKIKDKQVTAFFPTSKQSEIEQYLIDLSERKYHTKEYTSFCSKDHTKINFWWDIDNHLMFWYSDVDFLQNFKEKVTVIQVQ